MFLIFFLKKIKIKPRKIGPTNCEMVANLHMKKITWKIAYNLLFLSKISSHFLIDENVKKTFIQ